MYLQRVLLAIWVFGLLGVAAELVLLEHYEDFRQLIPFVVIAIGLVAAGWLLARPGRAASRAFGSVVALLALSGLIGLILHYRGNVEFDGARVPAVGGVSLIWESLTGATPALAPGTMILFAFIGYAVLVSRRPSGA